MGPEWTAAAIRFRVLGPIEVWLGNRQVEVGAAKIRAVLAVLLLRGNEVVSIDDLIEQVWSGSPPDSARTTVQAYVYRLRRLLQDTTGHLLQTRGMGYLMSLPPDSLDLHQFDAGVLSARRSIEEERMEEGVSRLRAALALWRGPALTGVPAGALTAAIQSLEAYRLSVTEEYLQAQLTIGRHVAILPELATATATHIYSEKLHAWLMLAQYRSGRRAEALATFARVRGALVADLGIEPGAELQKMHQAILAGHPPMELPPSVKQTDSPLRTQVERPRLQERAPEMPSSWRPVHELPADISRFAGRVSEQAALARLVSEAGGQPAPVCVITGMAGVGKSALAIHSGHQLARQYPDGALYVDLNGWRSGPPLRPEQVLVRWLRTMGVEAGDLPESLGEASALFRSVTAGRRLIVVLDNAYSATQVSPLLPASPTAAVLVTARRHLATLDNAVELRLGEMPPEEALAMLSGLIGPARVRDEPTVAATVARRCCHLPLAIRIAAARIAGRPDRPISTFARLLAEEPKRLDELRFGELDVRASLRASYEDLTGEPGGAQAAQLFRMLGLLRGTDVTLHRAAALVGWPAAAADAALEHLVDVNLLQSAPGATYQLSNLVRLFAREQVQVAESVTERHTALRRLHRVELTGRATARPQH